MSDCLTYAIHYLSRYPKTVSDTKKILAKKWFSSQEIDDTIPQLQKGGYLDDAAFARAYLNSEVVRKGKPVLLIKQKLLIKWVDKELLNELIEDMEEEMQEGQSTKIAKEITRLHEKGKTNPEIIQSLMRKGFAYEEIRKQI